MRVPDELKNSVSFLCVKDDENYRALGTAFFIAVPSISHADSIQLYLATAKHILDKARAKGYEEFYIRVNDDHGGAEFIELRGQWLYPEQPPAGVATPDVATMHIDFELGDDLSIAAIPSSLALSDTKALNSHNVGIGDEVLMIGLFRHRHGLKKNIPIVRNGILAAMPEEPLWDADDNIFDGYLVEIRSIGGLSGSPVLVFKLEPTSSSFRMLNQMPDLRFMFTNGYLLGLVRSHWDADNVETSDLVNEEDLNTGIAIVTPISEIMKLIERDQLHKNKEFLAGI